MYSSSRESLSLATTLEKTRSWIEPQKLKSLGKTPQPSDPAWLELWVLVAILDRFFFDQRAALSSRLRHGDISWRRAKSPKLCLVPRFGSKPDSGITSFINRLASNSCTSRFKSTAQDTYTSLLLSPWTCERPRFLLPNLTDITDFAEENSMVGEWLLTGFHSTFKARPWPVWFSRKFSFQAPPLPPSSKLLVLALWAHSHLAIQSCYLCSAGNNQIKTKIRV